MAEDEADLAERKKELEENVGQIQNLNDESTSLRRKNKKLENGSRVLELEAQIQRLMARNYSIATELRKLRSAAHGPKEDAQQKFENVCQDLEKLVLKKDEDQISGGEVLTADGEIAKGFDALSSTCLRVKLCIEYCTVVNFPLRFF